MEIFQVLGPEKWKSRENYIEENLCPKIPSSDLFSVNDVLKTKFRESTSKEKLQNKFEKMKTILTALINLVSLCFIIILLYISVYFII